MQIKNQKEYEKVQEEYELYRKRAFQQELNAKGILKYFDMKEAIKEYDSRNNRLSNGKKENPRAVSAFR